MQRILLIDDDATIRKAYGALLRADEYDVVDVGSAEEALDLLLKENTHFDLVITDIMMAKMDGWELLSTIRNQLKLSDTVLPVIVISAFESAELATKAFRYGANGQLVKPIVPMSKLLNLVRIHTGRTRSKYHDT